MPGRDSHPVDVLKMEARQRGLTTTFWTPLLWKVCANAFPFQGPSREEPLTLAPLIIREKCPPRGIRHLAQKNDYYPTDIFFCVFIFSRPCISKCTMPIDYPREKGYSKADSGRGIETCPLQLTLSTTCFMEPNNGMRHVMFANRLSSARGSPPVPSPTLSLLVSHRFSLTSVNLGAAILLSISSVFTMIFPRQAPSFSLFVLLGPGHARVAFLPSPLP